MPIFKNERKKNVCHVNNIRNKKEEQMKLKTSKTKIIIKNKVEINIDKEN